MTVHKLRLMACVGCAALLPASLALLANDAPVNNATPAPLAVPAVAPADASTTQPATQPTKTKEQRKEEDTARVMEFFRVTQPEAYEQAKTLQKCDPVKFDQMIHKTVSMVNKLEDLKKRNRPLFDMKMKDFELEYQTLKLGKDIKSPDISAADRDSMIKDLTDIVTTQFELRQQIRQAQIDDLQKQLADLEKQLQDRSADKDELIKKRVDDLIETVPELDW